MNQITLEEAIRFREAKAAEINRLLKTYGTGVRPGWVSTDIAIAATHRDRCQEIIDQYEREDNEK